MKQAGAVIKTEDEELLRQKISTSQARARKRSR